MNRVRVQKHSFFRKCKKLVLWLLAETRSSWCFSKWVFACFITLPCWRTLSSYLFTHLRFMSYSTALLEISGGMLSNVFVLFYAFRFAYICNKWSSDILESFSFKLYEVLHLWWFGSWLYEQDLVDKCQQLGLNPQTNPGGTSWWTNPGEPKSS